MIDRSKIMDYDAIYKPILKDYRPAAYAIGAKMRGAQIVDVYTINELSDTVARAECIIIECVRDGIGYMVKLIPSDSDTVITPLVAECGRVCYEPEKGACDISDEL